ncbi:MAG: hypothetical protein LBG81_02230 [Coriobacteriaceae bacterium]|jgi:hypothetical protein|nr:hypothetical protein [Coriobacteriaceae bacterium]
MNGSSNTGANTASSEDNDTGANTASSKDNDTGANKEDHKGISIAEGCIDGNRNNENGINEGSVVTTPR